MTDYIRFCSYCKLAYISDSRTYVQPDTYCPRCGKKLIEDEEEVMA